MAINSKSYILVLPRGNIIFYLISIKPFNILDIKTKVNLLKLEYNN